jgi:hypothetical protein
MTLDWTQGDLGKGLRYCRLREFFASAGASGERVAGDQRGPKTFLQALILSG